MLVAAYNVLSGGFDDCVYETKKPQRIELIQKAVGLLGVDFVGLIDTFRWNEIYTEKDIAELFGYKYAFRVNMNDPRVGRKNGVTVLSNLPNTKFEILKIYNRNCIKALLKYKKRDINIFTVYLDDLSEKVRLKEIKSLLGYIDDTPSVVMGDLNSLDQDEFNIVEEYLSRLMELVPEFYIEGDVKINLILAVLGMTKGNVLELLKKEGFKTTPDKKSLTATVPTKLNEFNIPSPFLRLDHILVNKGLKVRNLKVEKDFLMDKVSDHYPITANIEFT